MQSWWDIANDSDEDELSHNSYLIIEHVESPLISYPTKVGLPFQ